jgi:hypothetical protein
MKRFALLGFPEGLANQDIAPTWVIAIILLLVFLQPAKHGAEILTDGFDLVFGF